MNYKLLSGMEIDESKLVISNTVTKLFPTLFVNSYTPLVDAQVNKSVSPDSRVMVANVYGTMLIIDKYLLHYHHIVQGHIDGKVWMFGFCGACNSGSAYRPVINNEGLEFEVAGLYNGNAIFRDKKTGSLWENITGECFKGPLQGAKMEYLSPIYETKVSQLDTEHDEYLVITEQHSLLSNIIEFFRYPLYKAFAQFQYTKGFIAPHFRASMHKVDDRRPESEIGLTLWVNNYAKYYPLHVIKQKVIIHDQFDYRNIVIEYDNDADTAKATFTDGTMPNQVMSRWYGASFTFPKVEVYEKSN